MNRRIVPAALAIIAVPALALAGCSASAPATDGASGIHIVASTDVYADIAASIGGDLVTTQAIISGAAVDPHSYEASARDQLAVADADLIILNGGGYDPFMETLIAASGTTATVIVAVDASGLLADDHDDDTTDDATEDAADDATDDPTDDAAADDDHDDHNHVEGFNEHVWYSLHGMEHLAEAIEAALVELDPAGDATFEANTAEFIAGIESLETRADEIESSIGHVHALVSEPVALHLLDEVGIENVTPEAFTSAVEAGSEISIGLLDEVLSLATSGDIGLLAYNEQTVGPETARLLQAAGGAGVPVVSFSETLPAGQDYLSWMRTNLEAIATAVS